MPTKRYALEPGGPERVAVSWDFPRRNTRVLVDGQELGRFANTRDLRTGGEFALPDGSTLGVRLGGPINSDLLLTRHGRPLPGSSDDPKQRLRAAAGVVAFIAAISVVVGVLADVMNVTVLQEYGFGVFSIVFGLVFAGLALAINRGSLAALIVAIALFGIDTVLVLVATATRQGSGVGGIVARGFLFIPLIQAIPAARNWSRTPPHPATPSPPPAGAGTEGA